MAINSGISWTDHTWNWVRGCTKVSPACADCYMFRDMRRYGRDPTVVTRAATVTFNAPLNRQKYKPGDKVFTCSWSDFFHVDADPHRPEAWNIIRRRPDLIFQIVTKRTERIRECLPLDWGGGWPHVWLIATAENQEWLERRIGDLLSVPAAVHGVSIEPLLGEVKLRQCRLPGDPYEFDAIRGQLCRRLARNVVPTVSRLDWVIVGGESGADATRREMDLAAFERIIGDCRDWSVPVFVKQDSGRRSGQQGRIPDHLWIQEFPHQ